MIEHAPAQRVDGQQVVLAARDSGERGFDILGDVGLDIDPGQHIGQRRRGGVEGVEDAAADDDIAMAHERGNCASTLGVTPPSTTSSWPLT